MAIPSADAQLILGTARGPSVTVDWSVLDTLGPPPTLPQMLLQQRGAAPARQFAARPQTTRRQELALHHRPAIQTARAHAPAGHMASLHRPSKHRVAHKATGSAHLAQASAPSAPPLQTPEAAATSPAVIHLIRPGTTPVVDQAAATSPAVIHLIRPGTAAVAEQEAATSPAVIHLIRPGTAAVAEQEATVRQQTVAPPPPAEALAANEDLPPSTPPAPAENSPPAAVLPEPRVAAATPTSQMPVTDAGTTATVPASLLRVGAPATPAAAAEMPPAVAASPPVATPSALPGADTSPAPTPAAETPPAAAANPPTASPSSLRRVAAPSTPAPAERMVASLNPQLGPASAEAVAAAVSAVRFAPGLADLGADARPVLDAVVARLKANEALRIQLIAHATGGEDDAIEARRLSLARAVAVRAYLIEKGVRSLRMDVRALGNRTDGGGPSDRVDLVIVDQ